MQLVLPGLSTEEKKSLKRSLRDHKGIRIPIIALPDGRIIDGHHRHELSDEKPDVQILDIPEEKALALGLALNLARRQLSSEQIIYLHEQLRTRRELRKETALELRKQGKTQAEAATAVGVTRGAVEKWENVFSNDKSIITKTAPPDTRITVPRDKHPDILKRREKGESLKKIAADYKITPGRVSQIIEREKKKEAKTEPIKIKGKYRIFYADPPWKYRDSGQVTESDNYGRATRHFKTMSIKQLCGMGEDIKRASMKDAVLFLWVTSPLLEECFPVISAWGFKYKASFVWDKCRHNYGHYNSVRHEFLLICTKGNCTPDNKEKVNSVIRSERSGKHSEKPEEFRKIIEKLYSRGKRIELFARQKAQGWHAWGDQV